MSSPANEDAFDARIAALEAELRGRLSPDDYRLVGRLRHLDELATVAACTVWEERYLTALIEHFPNLELAQRGVAAHVRATAAACDTLQGRLARQQDASS